jgi:hypothetical protein
MSDIGTMLADTAERIFTAQADTIDRAASDGIWPAAAWDAIEESGLPLVLVPEDQGGFGVPVIEALALIRQSGRHALALPLAETIVANALLAAAGLPLESPGGVSPEPSLSRPAASSTATARCPSTPKAATWLVHRVTCSPSPPASPAPQRARRCAISPRWRARSRWPARSNACWN